jgi:hypothetical protein
MINVAPSLIPNIVTNDGNFKNDTFVLPKAFDQNVSLAIYNRWGKNIFSTANYQNNWPETDQASGVYFYILKINCLSEEYKGSIHLLGD